MKPKSEMKPLFKKKTKRKARIDLAKSYGV